MNRSSNSHSRIFLMELILAVLFFSLASAICLRMFASSRQMSREAASLTMAVNQAGNTAELLKNAQSNPDLLFSDSLLQEYPYAAEDTGNIAVYYDADWKHCPKENGVYCMEIKKDEGQDDIIPYQIRICNMQNAEAVIYSLELKLHAPNQP